MASGHQGAILGHIDRIFAGGNVAGLGEGQLLARFVTGRDELAFEALVTRLGPMVLGVCRRLLDDPRDVEDAFQATFLVLVRKAGSIRDRERLGPWLHGVAHRVAARARSQAARRRRRERSGVEAEAMAPARDGDRHELRSVVEEELGRLPEKYRAPIVLCYLEGLTHEEAAARLRCPVGTVRSRMAWARARLRARLDRRGLAPAEGMIGLALMPEVVPRALIESTVAGAIRLATGKAAAGAVPAGGMALAEGVSRTMIANKLTVIGGLVLSAGLVAGGAGVLARQTGGGPPPTAPAAEPAPATPDRDAPPTAAEVRALKQGIEALLRRQAELEAEVRLLSRQLGTRPGATPSAPTAPAADPANPSALPAGNPPSTPPVGGAGAAEPGAPSAFPPPPRDGGPPGTPPFDAPGDGRTGGQARVQSENNLKQIGLALHNFNDTHNTLPPQATRDEGGKPLLSWRVAILPFLDQNDLYQEFHQDEPWDSDHNKPLLARMPAIYALPGANAGPGMTFYQVFAGKRSAFNPWVESGVSLRAMTDGVSNTLAVVEAREAVPWSKPDDLPFEFNAPPKKALALRDRLGSHFGDAFQALFADGSVRMIGRSINLSVLRAIISCDGGEVVMGGSF